MKKTLTPLNDVYMRRAQHMTRALNDVALQHNVALNARRAMLSMHFAGATETYMA
jgi:hypothetical protein